MILCDQRNDSILRAACAKLVTLSCCALLCCAVLCCAVLCCAVLCCAVLCCAVLCTAVLCCAVLCCAVLCCAVLCCALLCCAVLRLLAMSRSHRQHGCDLRGGGNMGAKRKQSTEESKNTKVHKTRT